MNLKAKGEGEDEALVLPTIIPSRGESAHNKLAKAPPRRAKDSRFEATKASVMAGQVTISLTKSPRAKIRLSRLATSPLASLGKRTIAWQASIPISRGAHAELPFYSLQEKIVASPKGVLERAVRRATAKQP